MNARYKMVVFEKIGILINLFCGEVSNKLYKLLVIRNPYYYSLGRDRCNIIIQSIIHSIRQGVFNGHRNSCPCLPA